MHWREHGARVAAEQSNRAKNEFLANVSHELRTPMNAIMGMTELALKESLSPLVREFLSTVQSSSRVLLDLLNEILDFSKMEAGKFSLQNAPFGLHEIIDDLSRTYRFRAADKGLEFCSAIEPAVPDNAVGDSLRLKQILSNLLSNALKFTDQGRIAIEVTSDSPNGQESLVRFSVIDTGIGISPQDQERVFAPFAQADPSSTRRNAGIGLGLAIASDLIRAMRGKMSLQSEVGRGSTFSFTIPLKRAESPITRANSDTNGKETPSKDRALAIQPHKTKLRVLLAEDVKANQMLVKYALRQRGHEVDIAEDGREAVQRVAAGNYDVILMDVQMPELDGYQATAAIRALPVGARLPIIALTAHAMPADRDRCIASGMDGYLAKPLDLNQLIHTVESFASSAAGEKVH